jgi:hypothetical protein
MMNKNNQQPGKKLTREEMKKLLGGEPLRIPCKVTADCPNPGCTLPDQIKGNFCVRGACFLTYCP